MTYTPTSCTENNLASAEQNKTKHTFPNHILNAPSSAGSVPTSLQPYIVVDSHC